MLYPVAIIYDELEQLVSVSCIYHNNGFPFRRVMTKPVPAAFNGFYELNVYSDTLRGTSAIEIYKNDSLVSEPCYQPISRRKDSVLLASGTQLFWATPAEIANKNLTVANLGSDFVADVSLLSENDVYYFEVNSSFDLLNPNLANAKYISLIINKNARIQNLMLPDNLRNLISSTKLAGLYCSDKSRVLHIDAKTETFIAPPVCSALSVDVSGTVATLPKVMLPLFPRKSTSLDFKATKAVLTVDQRAYSGHLNCNDLKILACTDNQALLRFSDSLRFSCTHFPQYIEIAGDDLPTSDIALGGKSISPVHIYFDNIATERLELIFSGGYSAPKTVLHFKDTCKVDRLWLTSSKEHLVIQIDNASKEFQRLLIENCYPTGTFRAKDVVIYYSDFSFRIKNLNKLFAGNDFNSFYLEEYSKRLNGDDTNFLAALRHKETGAFAFPDKRKEVQPSVSFFVNRIM